MAECKSYKEAAIKAIKERWQPIANAKSINVMNDAYYNDGCAVCFYNHLTFSNSCKGCPMKTSIVCSKAYTRWYNAIRQDKFYLANKAAKDVVKELEAIAGITKGV